MRWFKYIKNRNQPPDFSQNTTKLLLGKSFKGKNLAGINLHNVEIRLCDFSDSNLEGANFFGTITGHSYGGVLFACFIVVFLFSIIFRLIRFYPFWIDIVELVFISVSLFVFTLFLIGTSEREKLSATWHVCLNLYGGLLIEAIAILSIFAESGVIATFSKGEISSGLGSCLGVVFLLWLSYILFRRAFIKIIHATGVCFVGANLSNTNFTNAILKNCDFTNSNLYHTDWTHAHFKRCKFSGNLQNTRVRELCISRIGTNENFEFIDLSGLNLRGVNLRGANLKAANLHDADLSKADLENANLANVQAIKTNFTGANLSGACIENWAITSETVFKDVICTHIFLDTARTERNPASGFFEQGDFEKLVTQSKNTLDFLFRNGIDPEAFDFALQQLKTKYPEEEISLRSVEDLGDGYRYVRVNASSYAPKADKYLFVNQNYEIKHQELEPLRKKVKNLQQKIKNLEIHQKISGLENELEKSNLKIQLAEIRLALEKAKQGFTPDIENLIDPKASRQQIINIKEIHINNGDFMPENQTQFQSSGGVVVIGNQNQNIAGRDISGTVTNTINQLRETNQTEAPQLAELLEELQKAVESSAELAEPDKEKALGYLNQIGEMSAKEPAQKKGMLPMLLDAFTGVISKAAPLIEPVKKIVEAILGFLKD